MSICNFEKELFELIDSDIQTIDNFNSKVSLLTDINTKSAKEIYYLYAVELIKSTRRLDVITDSISKSLHLKEVERSTELRNKHTALFEKCIDYRKLIEEYLFQAELLIKENQTTLPRILKKHSDIFVRKCIIIKGEIHSI